MTETARYGKVILKLSGEALMGAKGYGIDGDFVDRIAGEIAEAVALGVKVGLVIGGGNIVRGMTVAAEGGNRVAGDHMGMLATVINCIAVHGALAKRGVAATVLSAVPMPSICEPFSQRAATAAMDEGRVVLFAGGTGNPFFTTDSGAALRAAEMGCDAILKGTQVDGVYSADPKTDPSAVRYERLSHRDAIEKGLAVMDMAAFALARDNSIPIIVFSIHEAGAIVDVLCGRGRATVVGD
ncbi:UMP kinase [Rhodobium gokarnense]|uniref:Uridylate kinase n=1 Tax=Rhodobium gokarnense TaxID=364296 RepID=A0ABT3HB37_9HYPH|nr:UMP kinase [Rhodobium gokarnense]MCW2307613.1 uridylate kinase [Rhodobium gokarnense]